MTDEQLVLALIKAYKDRGIDMSYILDDPIFSKLPAPSRIKAIQTHARELHSGVPSNLTGSDYGRLASSTVFTALPGALAGWGIGSALASQIPWGVNKYSGAAIGATVMGLAGALAGGTKALSSIDDRRQIRNQLDQTARDPSTENAIGVLSTKHMHTSGRDLRDKILEMVSGNIINAGNSQVSPLIQSAHSTKNDLFIQANSHLFSKDQ